MSVNFSLPPNNKDIICASMQVDEIEGRLLETTDQTDNTLHFKMTIDVNIINQLDLDQIEAGLSKIQTKPKLFLRFFEKISKKPSCCLSLKKRFTSMSNSSAYPSIKNLFEYITQCSSDALNALLHGEEKNCKMENPSLVQNTFADENSDAIYSYHKYLRTNDDCSEILFILSIVFLYAICIAFIFFL